MEKVLIQLKRLKRHYNTSVKTYDHVSFLDLAHVLRIWTELKAVLPEKYINFKKKEPFVTGSPKRKILKQVQECQYVFAHLPNGGVVTYASNGQILGRPEIDDGNELSMGVGIEIEEFHFVKALLLCFKRLEQEYINILGEQNIARCNFSNWLGGEIVRLQFINSEGALERHLISREILIKRVANILDGSHTSLNGKGAGDNKFDEPVKWLMKFSCGGLPIPYFLLLKVAQDIIDNTPELLGIDG